MITVLQARGALRQRSIGRLHGGHWTITAASWLGLLLIFALSSLPTELAGRAPTQRNWVFGRLDRAHSFGQTFIAAPGELVAVRVLLFANPSDRDDLVTLRLRDAKGNLPTLAAVALPQRILDRHTWTTFKIQPLTLNLTTTLRLDIGAPTLSPNDWITVMAGPDSYADGELFANDMPHPRADLAFQPVYRRRWIDSILPITIMALGKPGALGWPPLYALLAYGCGVATAHLLLRLWRAARGAVDAL